ncbi:HAD hydrolase-like protein [Thalassobius aquimarinus]|uniref:HAD hydrolase-like protein n=1 Tax=Thalassovita aquimarina TaxID=2785917 RepID=A0ABS5HWN2_9RHOB|nr:HAD hydrolase-like protein [Thalassovita aquimarina]
MDARRAVSPATEACDRKRLRTAQRVLCDIDGCLVSGARVLPGALAFVQRFADRLMLVSNNSTDTQESLHRRLVRLGFELRPDQLVLAGQQALAWVANRHGPGPVFLLSNERMRAAASRLDLTHCDSKPRVVLVCRDTDLTLARLERALYHIAGGVPVILANSDITHPGEHGPAIESGALLQMLAACHPPSSVINIGKPNPRLLLQALGPVAVEDAVMIGDNPQTDGRAAQSADMYPILVGPAAGRWLSDFL